VHPACTVGTRSRILAHLEAELLPASQCRRELRAATGLALPVELGAHHAAMDRLHAPLEVDSAPQRSPCRPLDMRTERPGRGVHEQHASRGARGPRGHLRHLSLRS
jgi:hypothetical protein